MHTIITTIAEKCLESNRTQISVMGNSCLHHQNKPAVGTGTAAAVLPNIKVDDQESSDCDADIQMYSDTQSGYTPSDPASSPGLRLHLPNDSDMDLLERSGSDLGGTRISPLSDSVIERPSLFSKKFDVDRKLVTQTSEPFLCVPARARPDKLTHRSSDSRVGAHRHKFERLQSCSIFHSRGLEHSPLSSLPFTSTPVPELSTPINSSVVNSILATREDEFIWKDNLSIFCTTWNCHGKIPLQSELERSWLHSCPTAPDIFAIGLQEIDTGYEVLILNESSNQVSWEKMVSSVLNKLGSYAILRSVRLSSMFLMLFVKEGLTRHIKETAEQCISTGIGGILANKGGVGIRFQIHDSTLCFVNSHFSAHATETEKRNSEYKEILTDMLFQIEDRTIPLLSHNIVFWVGDLNYRFDVDDSFTYQDVIRHCQSNDLDALKQHDQFTQIHEKEEIFGEFQEGNITFPPTYKYDPGTNNWDSSSKKRCPAWCDRILWKGEEVEQLSYSIHLDILPSDHKPVSAIFRTGIRGVDKKKLDKIGEEVWEQVAQQPSHAIPRVQSTPSVVKFEDLQFHEQVTKTVTITNTSTIPVKISFVPPKGEKSLASPYLKICPLSYLLLAHSTVDLSLTIMVGLETIPLISKGHFVIELMLVLQVEGGIDHYIYVTGNYLPSSFGVSLEMLTEKTEAFRRLSTFDMTRSLASQRSQRICVPKELRLILEYLHSQALGTKDLFMTQGLKSEMRLIREALSKESKQLPKLKSVHSAADFLITFLMALDDPVIPCEFHSQCIEAVEDFQAASAIIEKLPTVHTTTFKYLIAFLKELLRNSKVNRLTSLYLSSIFALCMLRPRILYRDNGKLEKNDLRGGTKIHKLKSSFLELFLVNQYKLDNYFLTPLTL